MPRQPPIPPTSSDVALQHVDLHREGEGRALRASRGSAPQPRAGDPGSPAQRPVAVDAAGAERLLEPVDRERPRAPSHTALPSQHPSATSRSPGIRQPWFASTIISSARADRLTHGCDDLHATAPVGRVEAHLDGADAALAQREAALDALSSASARRVDAYARIRSRPGRRGTRRARPARDPDEIPHGDPASSMDARRGSRRLDTSRTTSACVDPTPTRRVAAPRRAAHRRSRNPRRRRRCARSRVSPPNRPRPGSQAALSGGSKGKR